MINCSVIRDLLPIYADGETSPETTQEIKTHLTHCVKCREYYKDILHSTRTLKIELKKNGPDFSAVAARIRRHNIIMWGGMTIAFAFALCSAGHIIADEIKNKI